MSSPPLSYTPADRVEEPQSTPVHRRHVFYMPGYDADATRRYRALFVREFARYAKRFGVLSKSVSRPVPSADGLVQAWTVGVETKEWRTTSRYEVLLWDDLVQADARRSIMRSVGLLFQGIARLASTLTLFRVYRLSPKFGNVMLYPFTATILIALAGAMGVAAVAELANRFLGLPAVVGVPLGLAAAAGAGAFVRPHLDRIYYWQLLHDWNFHWQHGHGRRPDYQARLDQFARQVVDRAREVGADEIMLVGHSTGALTAVEVAARALALDPALGTARRPVALVTLGSAMPLVAMQPEARGLRTDVADLIASDRVAWVDYQAPQDWMNFPGFNPVRDLSFEMPPQRVMNPFVRSARYRDTMEPTAYRAILMRPFRLHFQFLMANDLPGEYDYFALTLGPQRLLDRLREPLLPRTVDMQAAAADLTQP